MTRRTPVFLTMRRPIAAFGSLLLLSIFASPAAVFAQKTDDVKVQIATVSISRIVDSYERTKNLNTELKEKEDELKVDLEKIKKNLDSAMADLKAFETRVTELQRKGKIPKDEAVIQKLKDERGGLIVTVRKQELLFGRKNREVTRDLADAKRNSQIILVRDILTYIRNKIKETDYDAVVNMPEKVIGDTLLDGGFMFARNRTDITDRIIQGLNKQYKALPK